jgi:hypothetical protein
LGPIASTLTTRPPRLTRLSASEIEKAYEDCLFEDKGISQRAIHEFVVKNNV